MDSDRQFEEAVKNLQAKGVLPTDLSSAEIRQMAGAVRRQAIFSARTTSEEYLNEIKLAVQSVVEPVQDERGVTVGYNPATAAAKLRRVLARLGYAPAAGEEGTIKDLSSDARLKLVVKTNVQLAQGAGHFVQQNADPEVVEEYPALELVRFEDRKVPRDWEQRWTIAARVAGDNEAAACLELNGRMCALKSSGIWEALGDGAGGYTDTLGNPFPPFAFNSGMWTQEVSRADAQELGLIDEGEEAEPAKLDWAELFHAN